MKSLSKILALGLLASMLASSLIACDKKEVDPAPVSDPAQEVQDLVVPDKDLEEKDQEAVTIRTISQFGGADPSAAVYQELLADFQAQYSKITVEDQSAAVDEAWMAKVASDFAANNEPDVIYTFTGLDAEKMIEEDQVVSIEEIQAEFPDYGSNILARAFKSVEEFDGRNYAIPVRGFYQGLFVNKALFEEHELDLPSDWEKMEIAIEAFKEKGILPIAAALGDQPDQWIDHLILSQGGPGVHSNRDIAAVKDDWLTALEYIKTLYDMGAFPKDTNSITSEITKESFFKGEAAMLLDDNRVIAQFESPEDMTVMPLPVLPGGKADQSAIISGYSAGWYITRSAWEHPAKRKAAVKFVQAMTTNEAISQFLAVGDRSAADIGEREGLPTVALEGLAMEEKALEMDRPIDSWLAKPAWDKLLSLVPGIVSGEEDPARVVDQVIILHKK